MTAPAQPPNLPPPRREPRPWTDFDLLVAPQKEERATIGSALLLTILFHGMMFMWVLPWLGEVIKASHASAFSASAQTAPPPVEYTLAPVTKEDMQALRYVEANPNAPVAKPVATNNISNRDQRVAQPVPNPDGRSDMPAVNGTLENSAKIVQGVNNPPPPAPAPAPTPTPASATPPAPAPATAPPPVVVASTQTSLTGKPITSDGEGVRISDKPGDASTETKPNDLPPTVTEQQIQRPLPPGPLTPETVAASAAAATPETRPTTEVKTHAGPLVKSIQGTHVAGIVPGVDAKFSQYGQYLSLMYEAIASAWDAQCDQFTFSPRDWGTQVDTVFVLNAQGEVEDVAVERSTASRAATLMCVSAIKTPVPFGKWSPEMRALLGERQTIRITFYYE